MPDTRLAAIAFARFGLGPRPGDLDRFAADPRGLLLADVKRGAAQPAGDLPDAPAALALLREQDSRIRAAREGAKVAEAAASPMTAPAADSSGQAIPPKPEVAGPPAPPAVLTAADPPVAPRLFNAEARARIALAAGEPVGFAERLVWFWSNHFAVSALKGNNVRAIAGAFEREAIRPHVMGRFADLLLAAETHPAMIFYLDGAGSVGPRSNSGKNRSRGLNENLGREVLELHTLGVGGGYGQDDVTALACILTGWTVVGPEGRLGRPGTVAFNTNAHEPGELTLLGRTYPDHGPDQLRAALGDLARHPSTALHIARKLARHFVADEPPPTLVERLADTFRRTDGQLSAVYETLVTAPEAWRPERPKLRSPAEFLLAALRLTAPSGDAAGAVLGAMGLLGQSLWAPHEPNGYPDGVADWGSAEGLKLRLDLSARAAARPPALDPAALLAAAFGDAVSPETRDAVMRAESRPQAVALLLMAPEFQRR